MSIFDLHATTNNNATSYDAITRQHYVLEISTMATSRPNSPIDACKQMDTEVNTSSTAPETISTNEGGLNSHQSPAIEDGPVSPSTSNINSPDTVYITPKSSLSHGFSQPNASASLTHKSRPRKHDNELHARHTRSVSRRQRSEDFMEQNKKSRTEANVQPERAQSDAFISNTSTVEPSIDPTINKSLRGTWLE